MNSPETKRCLELLERTARQSCSFEGDWLSVSRPERPLRSALVRLASQLGKRLHFHEQAPSDLRLSLLHIDTTDPQEVSRCCDLYYPCLGKEGIAVVEHYESLEFPEVLQAVHAFFEHKPEFPTTLGSEQAFIIK